MENNISNKNYSEFDNSTRNDFKDSFHRISPIVVTALLLIVVLWFLISIILYGKKSGKWKKSPRKDFDKLNAGKVYSFVTICAVLCSLRLIASEIQLFMEFEGENQQSCNVMNGITSGLYVLIVCSVYSFLWIRQRVFFANSMLNRTYNKWVTGLSRLIVVPLIIGSVAAIVGITILSSSNTSTINECSLIPDHIGAKALFTLLLWFSVIVGQSVMLGLFAYALTSNNIKCGPKLNICHRKSKNAFKNKSNKTNTFFINSIATISATKVNETDVVSESNQRSPVMKNTSNVTDVSNRIKATKKSVKLILKKTLYFALLSTLIDFVTLALNLFLTSFVGRRYLIMILNINIFFNLLFILLSFHNWKKIVMLPCTKT